MTTRARAGSPTTYVWPITASEVDWARVPKNCHATTPQGGGGVLGSNVDFYADQCVIAVSPNPVAAGGVLAQAMAMGPDGRVYARALKANPFGGDPVWGPYYVVPGLSNGATGDPAGVKAKKIAIAAAKDGSFQVVIIHAANDSLYHAMQYPNNGNWSGFGLLDGVGTLTFAARDVAIAINGSSPTSAGNAQVIANGLEAASVFHRVRWPNGTWTPFAQVPGAQGMNTQALAIASSDDLYTNVLAITTAADGSQGQIQQVLRDPSGNWAGWVTVPTPAGTTLSKTSDLALTRTNLIGNPAYLMFLDATGNVYFQVRNNPNLPASWQGQAPTDLITTQGRTVSLSGSGFGTSLLVTRVYPQ
ncbi:hypothetical protein A8M77_33595 [Variovorax sp. JS1663]|nr:hypothetical protein A8M77_33595 [Variovorax sp. JS1663]